MRFDEHYLTEENIIDSENIDEIFNFIFTQPIKYKILTKNLYEDKIYDKGFDTAVNSTIMLKFYLKYLRDHKKTSSIFHVPERINYQIYDKLNDVLKYGQSCDFEDEWKKTFHKGYIFTIFSGLMYETYLGDKIFKYASIHNEINNLKVPTSCEEYFTIFEEILYNKDNKIRHAIFFADTIPFVKTLESYI